MSDHLDIFVDCFIAVDVRIIWLVMENSDTPVNSSAVNIAI